MTTLRRTEAMSIVIPGSVTAPDSAEIVSWSSSSPQSSGPSTPEFARRPSDPISIPGHIKTRSTMVVSPVSSTPSAVCPNCGLRRRPSLISIVEAGGSSPSHFSEHMTPKVSRQAASHHWPTDECCEEWCPDSVRPKTLKKSDDSFDLPPGRMLKGSNKRHHRRRRSSLCYAESFADDDEDIKIAPNRDCVVDKQVVVKVAEVIAQKVVQRSRRPSQDISYFTRPQY